MNDEGGAGDAEGQDAKSLIDNILVKHKIENARVILAMLAGSHAFNLAVATSDHDYFGIYAAPMRSLYCLQPPADTIDAHDPDYQIHEVRKYLEILLKGNPKVIEPLFAPRLIWSSGDWEEMKKLKRHLLTKVTLDQYISYSISQLKGVEKAPEAAPKKYCHAIRLMKEAERIANGGEPIVWHDGELYGYFQSIRRGDHSTESLQKTFEEIKQQVESINANVPATTDLSILNAWLLSVRKKDRGEVTIWQEEDADTNELKVKAQGLLAKHGIKGRIIAVIPSGSKTHGIAGEDSVEDYVAVYVAPTEDVLSLTPPTPIVSEDSSKQKDYYHKGMVIFEAESACRFLFQGNHRLLEAVYLDEAALKGQSYETEEWQRLKAMRANFILPSTLNHYVGVARGQLKTNPLGSKNLYHALRLLFEAENILNTNAPKVVLEGEQREVLLKLRAALSEAPPKDLLELADKKVNELTNRLKKVPKAVCDRTQCDEWLIDLRNKHWTS